jgi:hypothetical protein
MVHDRRQSANKRPVVQVIRSARHLHVWYCEDGKRHELAGTITAAIEADARRYGQDLLGDLIDRALRMADRRRTEAQRAWSAS